MILSEIPIKLWKGSHTEHFSEQYWSYSSGFHWWLQCNSVISAPAGLSPSLSPGRSAVPADLHLLLSRHTKGGREKRTPENIPLASKATAFQTQWMCAEHEILLTTASILHQDSSVPQRALWGFHMFLRAQKPSGFTLSQNLMCFPSLSDLYLHPKSSLHTFLERGSAWSWCMPLNSLSLFSHALWSHNVIFYFNMLI